jgi:hypothetical protein
LNDMTLSETFYRNPVGIQPHPAELGQRPEASLAWASVTASAKRRQRRCRTMLLSPEIAVVGVLVFSPSGDRGGVSYWPDTATPAGVLGTWWASTGVPQEQERSVVSAREIGSTVVPTLKRPGPRSRATDRRERMDVVQLAVPPDERHEAGGTDRQKSECPHSTENHAAERLPHGPRGAN